MNLSINWGAFPSPNVADSFNQGFAIAQRNALLRRDMEQQDEALALRRAEVDRQTRQDARRERMELTADMQRFIGTGARVIQQIQPQDDAGWQQVLGTMQQLGFDVSEVPRQFDPNYAAQVVQAGQAIMEHTGEAYTLGPGDIRFGPDNQEVARGAPRPDRVIPVPAGGGVYIENDGGGTFAPMPGGPQEQTATNPETGERVRLNPQTGQWEPMGQGGASPSNGSRPF